MHCPSVSSNRTVQHPQQITNRSKPNARRSEHGKAGVPPTADSDTLIFSRIGKVISHWAIYACLLIFLYPSILPAAQVKLAWDPNSGLADGYHVYQRMAGEEYDYSVPVWASSDEGADATTCTIEGLAENITYYFVVRSCAGPFESSDSNEVAYRTLSNRIPEASIGGNRTVMAGSIVNIDGSKSYDRDGESLTYDFQQTNGPNVDLNCSGAQCSFKAPEEIERTSALTFELTVGDESGQFDTATAIILVDPAPSVVGESGATDPYANVGNNGPDLPALTSPANGATNVELSPWLRTSPFSDPDGDGHLLTQWQITDTAAGIEMMDLLTIDRYLTDIKVPQLILNPLTQYSVRVRFFDHSGRSSQWSEPTIFSVGDDSGDLNKNHIPDNLEVSEHTDMNNDTIADLDQPTVIKSISIDDGQYLVGITLAGNSNTTGVSAIASVDPNVLDTAPGPGVELPLGLLNYKIPVSQPGESVDVTIYLSDPIDAELANWARYDNLYGWRNSSAITVMDAEGYVVERNLRDGGEEDADGVANGIIIDLSGPLYSYGNNASLTGSDNAPAASGGGGGGCFIGSIFGAN